MMDDIINRKNKSFVFVLKNKSRMVLFGKTFGKSSIGVPFFCFQKIIKNMIRFYQIYMDLQL